MHFRSFVGSFGNLSVHVSQQSCSLVPTNYLKSQQNIEINITVLECENAKFSKLARSARSRIHIDSLNVIVLSVYSRFKTQQVKTKIVLRFLKTR